MSYFLFCLVHFVRSWFVSLCISYTDLCCPSHFLTILLYIQCHIQIMSIFDSAIQMAILYNSKAKRYMSLKYTSNYMPTPSNVQNRGVGRSFHSTMGPGYSETLRLARKASLSSMYVAFILFWSVASPSMGCCATMPGSCANSF